MGVSSMFGSRIGSGTVLAGVGGAAQCSWLSHVSYNEFVAEGAVADRLQAAPPAA